MPQSLIFDAGDEQATARLGAALATVLPPRAMIALIGQLGAGKTRLVQAVARAAGVEEASVASPTFVLVHEYCGTRPIYHFDTYRLRSEAEFAALGPEEYFAADGWSFVEWADRVPGCLPPERLEITIESTGLTSRRFTICSVGAPYTAVMEQLRRNLPDSVKK